MSIGVPSVKRTCGGDSYKVITLRPIRKVLHICFVWGRVYHYVRGPNYNIEVINNTPSNVIVIQSRSEIKPKVSSGNVESGCIYCIKPNSRGIIGVGEGYMLV